MFAALGDKKNRWTDGTQKRSLGHKSFCLAYIRLLIFLAKMLQTHITYLDNKPLAPVVSFAEPV